MEAETEKSSRGMAELVAIVEALIFVADEPITTKLLAEVLEEDRDAVDAAVVELQKEYESRESGLQIREIAGGWQLATRTELHEEVRKFLKTRPSAKLSLASLETLAVIAYKQPITAAEITEIRGVNTSGVIGTLLERGLVKISGRKQVVGRPFLYSTTRDFLDRFGLRDVHDLPKVEDMADALGFEVPVGIAAAAAQPGDEPATAEDAAVVMGETGESEDV